MLTKAETIKKKREEHLPNQDYINRNNFIQFLKALDSEVQFCEMYQYNCEDGSISCKFNYEKFKDFWNTRTKLKSETILEIDKLDLKKTVSLICEIALKLIKRNISFYCFYAEGGRSPYLVIYDFKELADLEEELQHVKAQIIFWKKFVPLECFKYIDTGIFEKDHLRPLEYSPHWKYGSKFKLFFNFKAKTEYERLIEEKKYYSSLRAKGINHQEARRKTNAKFIN